MSEALRGVPGPGEMTTLSKLDSFCASSRQLSSSFFITTGATADKKVLYDCREHLPDLMQGIDWGMCAAFSAEQWSLQLANGGCKWRIVHQNVKGLPPLASASN